MKLLLLAALAASPLAVASPIIREPSAIYLSDFARKPLRLKLARPAPCFFDLAMTRYAGTLRFPQTVQVEAFAENACRIRGNAQQGGVAAWLPYEDLEPLPEGLLPELRKADERRRTVEALISQNEVAIGMTEDEVQRSVGKPRKKTKLAEKDLVRQVWEYVRYQLVPQTTYGPGFNQTIITVPGQTNKPPTTIIGGTSGLVASTIYVKVPVGRLSVTFENGVVSSMEQSEGTTVGAGAATIVAPPLEILW